MNTPSLTPSVAPSFEITVDEQTYLNALQIVKQYRKEKLRKSRSRIAGYSKCPFCGGTKTTPFLRQGKNQNCTDCNPEGMISNRKLYSMDLTDFIQKDNN